MMCIINIAIISSGSFEPHAHPTCNISQYLTTEACTQFAVISGTDRYRPVLTRTLIEHENSEFPITALKLY